MNNKMIAPALVAGSLLFSVSLAQPSTVLKQDAYTKTYQQLGVVPAQSQTTVGTTGDNKVEEVFNSTYQNTVGYQPSFDEYLQWKYLTTYPDSGRLATERARQQSSAVREIPPPSQPHKNPPMMKKTHMENKCGAKGK